MRVFKSCLLLGLMVGSVHSETTQDSMSERPSAELTERATRLYRERKFEAAYQAMREALPEWQPEAVANPSSYEALADFSLIAFRAGHLQEAVESGRSVILDAPDPKLRAAAWFNMGLACERNSQSSKNEMLQHCSSNGILQYLNAWNEFPTKDREHKVVASLDEMPSPCPVEVYYGRREDYFLVQTGEPATIEESPQRIVVRHVRGSPPPVNVAEWTLGGGPPPVIRRTFSIKEYELSAVSISVLRGLGEIESPVLIRGQQCQFN